MRTAPSAIHLPGCKSASQRALVLGALAGGENRIHGLSACRDSMELLAALAACGVEHRWEGVPGAEAASLILRGAAPQEWQPRSQEPISVGEGASTLRFLMATLGAGIADVRLRPAAALAARPHGELVQLLQGLGAEVTNESDASGALLRIRGCGGFGARRVEIPKLRSSQTLSALWMAAGDAPITWSLAENPSSRGYLDLTAEMMRHVRGDTVLREVESQRLWEQAAGFGADVSVRVLADPSAAVFFAVASILLGQSVRVARPWNSRHADAELLRHLRQEDWLTWIPQEAGVEILPGPSARSRSLVLDLDPAPDSGPALAVLAAHLPHGARFSGLSRLRIKESDRVSAMLRLAEACGAEVRLSEDELSIRPGADAPRLGQPAPRRALRLAAEGDHRTAMATGVAALLHPGLESDQPACVAKSFPNFWEELACLRG